MATDVLSSRGYFKTISPFLWTTVPIVISYFFPQDELKTFLIFVMLIPIFTIYKFDGRVIIGYAISLLLLIAVLTIRKEENYNDQIATFSYWLLVDGICCIFIESFRKK
jgi:hypothetical protein